MRVEDFHEQVYWPIRRQEIKRPEKEEWWWTRHLLPAFGTTKLKDLNAIKWTTWLASHDEWSGRTKVVAQGVYRALLRFAIQVEALDSLHSFRPIKGSKRVTRPAVPLTLDEVEALLDSTGSRVHRAMFATGIGQGLRPSELAGLQREDFDWQAGTIHIRGTKTEGSEATVPMTSMTRQEVEPYWQSLGEPYLGPCWVFRGKLIKEFKHSLADAGQRAGLDHHVTPYSLRHTFAGLCAVSGVPQAAARKLMRHSSDSRILEGAYQNLRESQVAQSMESFPEAAK